MFTTYQLVIRISLAHPPYRNHHQFSHHSPIILPSLSHHSPIILPSFSHHSPIIFAWRFAWGQECSLMTVKTYMLLSGVLVLRREKVPELVLGRGVPRYICGLNQQESMVEPTEPWDSRPENQREFLLQQRW